MRKLLQIPALAGLLAAPAAQADILDTEPPGDPALISSPVFSNPLDSQEAESRLRAARRSAAGAAPEAAASAAAEPSGAAVPAQLQAIAACESGGDPSAVSANGAYRGKYQFSPATWQAVGGTGDPAAAPEAEQDRRAVLLHARSGTAQWPACGQ